MVNGRISLPVGTLSAAKFLTYLRNSDYSKSSIKLSLVSLKWINSFFPGVSGVNDPLKDDFLNKIVDSSQRNIDSKKNQKLPFSADMIKKMMDLDINETLENLRNALIPALGFSLLLRHDELSHISLAHMTLCKEGIKFLIPSSKTDVFRNGRFVFLARQSGQISVFDLLMKFISKADLKIGENKFLFCEIRKIQDEVVLDGSRKLSYSKFLEIIRNKAVEIGLNPNLYGTHSNRSGGATTLASRVTPFELMVSGRWADPRSINNYVEIDKERRFDISKSMFV
jgi:hypothetical protein